MSIQKLGPKKWRIFSEVESASKRKRISEVVYGDRQQAENVQARLNSEAQRIERSSPDSSGRTIADLLDRWLNQQPGAIALSTLMEYRRLADKRIIPQIGHLEVAKLEPWELEAFYADLLSGQRGTPLSRNSVRQIHAIIRRGCFHAIRWGWISRNPANDAQAPKQTSAIIVQPTDDEVGRLFAVADLDGNGLGVAVTIAAMCGLRRAEILGLTIDAIDLERKELRTQQSALYVRSVGVVIKDCKTHQRRAIPLARVLLRALETWIPKAQQRALDAGVEPIWLFPKAEDPSSPWPSYSWDTRWKKIRSEADCAHVTLHQLRHWFATTMLDDAVGGPTVASMMGYTSVDTLNRVYAHRVDSSARRGIAGLGDRFEPDKPKKKSKKKSKKKRKKT